MSKGKLERATKNSYTLREIERGIRYRELLYSYAERGDVDSIHLLVDAEEALRQANPTDKQKEAVRLVWRESKTLAEAGDILGITLHGVRFNLQLLEIKLQRVLDRWRAQADRGLGK